MILEKKLTTAGTANTAKNKKCVCTFIRWLSSMKHQKSKEFAVPAVFAVVKQGFSG